METVHNLEKTVAGWYKNVPHLPKNGQKWLADNAWWLAAIGVAISVLGLLGLIPLAIFAFGFSTVLSTTSLGYGYSPSGLLWLSVLVSLVVMVIYVILTARAITPLKAHKKRGWDLLFLVFLIEIASSVLNVILTVSISGLIGGLISAAIGAYFLFEVRSYFLGAKLTNDDVKKVVEVKKA